MNRTQHEAARALNALILRPGMTDEQYIAQVCHIVQVLPLVDNCRICKDGEIRWPDRQDIDGTCHYTCCDCGHVWRCSWGVLPNNPFTMELAR
jgi:DNA-directed RNA polymerase subunit M/transcription elongation factor TFIIS